MTDTTTTDTALPYPHFGVNVKIYPDTHGEAVRELARLLARIEAEVDTGARFVLTPQLPDLRTVAGETGVAVTAPYMDAVTPGRGMGKILPETLADAGVDGVVINHAENRDTLADIAWKVDRCRELGMDSLVCVDSLTMGRSVAVFSPDTMIYEKPEDISTDRAITQTHPDRVRQFVSMVEEESPQTRVLLGGGISTAEDVRLAFDQGADAAGAASAVSLADDRESLLRAIAAVFP